jgi:hypothetical protein
LIFYLVDLSLPDISDLWADMSGQGRTYPVQGPDISDLPRLFTLLSVDSSWVPHRAFTSYFLSLMTCTHSCSVFLKEMTHGDECRLKHRQDAGASSSGPSTKPKKLAKRPRLSSYQEESSPEVSPPHGGTPDETECHRMHSPKIHTNWEIVNYSKEDHMNVMHLLYKPCYSSSKERGTDERFWTFFHQDWYRTVFI